MKPPKTLSPSLPHLDNSNALHQSLLDSLPLGVYRIDREGRIIYANTPMLEILGVDRDQALGAVIYDFFPKHIADNQRKDDEWIVGTGLPISKTPSTGHRHYRREMKSPVLGTAGEIIGVQGIFWDATELMQAHADLKESEERFNLFMDTLPAAVFMKDSASTTIYCNRYMLDILGAKRWQGKNVHDHFPRELADQMIADDQRSLEAGYVVVEEPVPHADGQLRLYQTHKFAIPRQGQPPLLGGIALDITERKEAEMALQSLNARLNILATTDQLTGLANRRHLTERLEQEFERWQRYEKYFGVILLDIDHFKSINDRFGHQAGDSVLSQLAAILTGHVRAVDTAGRWGGEEFLIICPETTLDGVATLAEKMRQRIEHFDFGIPASVTASFGVAASLAGISADTLVKAADDALYEAKTISRNRVVKATSKPALPNAQAQ